jgi:hypothetical protein
MAPATETNGQISWTRLSDLVAQSGRADTTVRLTARKLGLDIKPRSDLRRRGAGKTPLCIPSTDVPALLDILKQSNGKARKVVKHATPRKVVKAPVEYLSKLEQLRRHAKAIAVLCRDLEAEVTVTKDGVAEVNRWTVEKITAGAN